MSTALVSFGADASAVSSHNAKTGVSTVRLMTAKEFKTAKGLTGQAAKKAYNDYLREQGKANTAGLAAAMTSGELLVKGYQAGKNGLRVSFAYASKLKDPKSQADAAMSQEDAELVAALKASGLSLEDLKAMAGKQSGN